MFPEVIVVLLKSIELGYTIPGMSFKKNFLVLPFGVEENDTAAWIKDGDILKKFKGIFFEFDGFGCALTIPSV